jgi:hypothetical protein
MQGTDFGEEVTDFGRSRHAFCVQNGSRILNAAWSSDRAVERLVAFLLRPLCRLIQSRSRPFTMKALAFIRRSLRVADDYPSQHHSWGGHGHELRTSWCSYSFYRCSGCRFCLWR